MRLNPQDETIWLEYFKLELLWVKKIKERRKVLFGEKNSIEIIDGGIPAEGVQVPLLPEEKGLVEGEVEKEQTIKQSSQQGNDDMMEEELSPLQKAIIEIAIPRAVYRNAVKAIPKIIAFRTRFVNIYEQYGDEFQTGIDEVFESIERDFEQDALAQKVLAERFLVGIDPETTPYPMALKKCIDEYQGRLIQMNTVTLWNHFSDFLVKQINQSSEPHLLQYLDTILMKCYTDSSCLGKCSLSMFLDWISRTSTNDEKSQVLKLALDAFPTSGLVWIQFIYHQGAKAELFEKALGQVSPVDKYLVWTKFLEYSIEKQDQEDVRFKKALADVGPSYYEPLVAKYVSWSMDQHGLDGMRHRVDQLIKEKFQPLSFYRLVLDLEMKAKAPVGPSTRARIQKLWHLAHQVAPQDLDTWMDHIQYEYNIGNAAAAGQLYWNATKHVPDQSALETRYQQVKTSE